MISRRFPWLSLGSGIPILIGLALSRAGAASAIADPYRWLEDSKSSSTVKWVEEQNRAAESYLEALPQRRRLTEHLQQLYRTPEISSPQQAGRRLFYQRRDTDQESPVLYWREIGSPTDHVLVDRAALGDWHPSPRGRFIAYGIKIAHGDAEVLHLRDVTDQKEAVGEQRVWANYADLAWTPDEKGYYYTHLSTDTSVPDGERIGYADVRYHALGTATNSDSIVYPATHDPAQYLTPLMSADGRWLLVIVNGGWTSTTIRFRPAAASSAFEPLFISTNATASVSVWKDRAYVLTQQNAPHGRVLEINLRKPSTPVTLVPQRQTADLESLRVMRGRLVLLKRSAFSMGIEIRDLRGRLIRTIAKSDEGSVDELMATETSDTGYFEFETFFQPPTVYEFSIRSATVTSWAETSHTFDRQPHCQRLDSFRSKDGTRVTMFILSRAPLPRDGSTPFLLEGYGGFGVSLVPRFEPGWMAWLDAGGAIAIPHLRGGGEQGEAWHRAGMLDRKQNTFDDFIAAAQYLIKERYTTKDSLVIAGASNGGLLVAAVMVQRPDLFRAALCKNPLTDMIRYPMFGQGQAWIPEYGSPDDPAQRRYLLAYSPYHQVQPGTAYPATLIMASDGDDRVDPMHARKFAAALDAANSGIAPILFRSLHDAGHGGADRTSEVIQEWTDRLAFLMAQVGLSY